MICIFQSKGNISILKVNKLSTNSLNNQKKEKVVKLNIL